LLSEAWAPHPVTANELRARLVVIVAAEQPGRIAHGSELSDILAGPPIAAAVLVAFVLDDPPSVLLTKRTAHLSKHPGQVSFPGGRIDPTDTDAIAAALREAQEEIALDPARVTVLGSLSDFLTGTGYRITPVIGLVPAGLAFQPSPNEVEIVFELPLSVLLDPEAPRLHAREVEGRQRDFWVWPHSEHYIWGATAAILVHLARALRAPG
jgi:8-oxo-dGTP pyrophosphatase MutT (NUDIX family)